MTMSDLDQEHVDLVSLHEHPGEGGEEEEVQADSDHHAHPRILRTVFHFLYDI